MKEKNVSYYNITTKYINGQKYQIISDIIDKKSFQKYVNEHDGIAPKIPHGAYKISKRLFKGIRGIKSIYIPDTVKNIDAHIFSCFKGIVINYGNFYHLIIKNMMPTRKMEPCFKIKSINKNIVNEYLKQHAGEAPPIPEGVFYLGEYIFKGLENLKQIKLPETAVAICKQCFMDCINLKGISLPSKLVYLGEEVFRNCQSLSGDIYLPRSISYIRANTFLNCKSISNIIIFNKYKCTLEEFILKDDLDGMNNIFLNDENLNLKYKSLRTNNIIFVLYKNKTYKLSKNNLINLLKFDKYLGYKPQNFSRIWLNNDGLKLLLFKLEYEKNKTNTDIFPLEFIISSSPFKYINNFFYQYKIFLKNILNKITNISKLKRLNDKNVYVGKITEKQFETIYRLCLLAGFFENNTSLKQKIEKLFDRLFSINCDGLSLSIEEFMHCFISLNTCFQTLEYNKEFSDYFLFQYDGLKLFVNAVLKSSQSDSAKVVSNLIINSGNSNIFYEHDQIKEKSKGKLHDLWIQYKSNNNIKEKNIGVEKKQKTLTFMDWAIKYSTSNEIYTCCDYDEHDKSLILPFKKYYKTKEPIDRLLKLINESKNVVEYVYLSENNEYCFKKQINTVVSRVGIQPEYKIFDILIPRENKKEDLEKVFKNDSKFFKTKNYCDFCAKIIAKNDYQFALANCEMGHCANIMGTGAEYLYEAFLSSDCQPFLIYKKDKSGDKAIASFRINVDRIDGIGVITSCEVLPEVKFEFKIEQKEAVVKCFYEIVRNFANLYNKYNKNILNYISLGQVTHFDINDVFEKYFPLIEHPVNCDFKRKTVCPSELNHLMVWNKDWHIQVIQQIKE